MGKRYIENGLNLHQVAIKLTMFNLLFIKKEFPIENHRFYLLNNLALDKLDMDYTHHFSIFMGFIRSLDSFQIDKFDKRIHEIHIKFHQLFLIIDKARKIKKGAYLDYNKFAKTKLVTRRLDRLPHISKKFLDKELKSYPD